MTGHPVEMTAAIGPIEIEPMRRAPDVARILGCTVDHARYLMSANDGIRSWDANRSEAKRYRKLFTYDSCIAEYQQRQKQPNQPTIGPKVARKQSKGTAGKRTMADESALERLRKANAERLRVERQQRMGE